MHRKNLIRMFIGLVVRVGLVTKVWRHLSLCPVMMSRPAMVALPVSWSHNSKKPIKKYPIGWNSLWREVVAKAAAGTAGLNLELPMYERIPVVPNPLVTTTTIIIMAIEIPTTGEEDVAEMVVEAAAMEEATATIRMIIAAEAEEVVVVAEAENLHRITITSRATKPMLQPSSRHHKRTPVAGLVVVVVVAVDAAEDVEEDEVEEVVVVEAEMVQKHKIHKINTRLQQQQNAYNHSNINKSDQERNKQANRKS